MGIGVLDMIEMYASSVCDTQTLIPKEPIEPPASGTTCRQGHKRRMSVASEDSGRPRSPWSSTRSPLKSPRNQKKKKQQQLKLLGSSASSSAMSSSPESTSNSSGHSISNRYTVSNPYAGTTDTEEDEEIVKRSRLDGGSSAGSSSSSSGKARESYESRRKRFLRTAEALRHSGLLDITMKTAQLLRKNQELQKEIENLQKETRSFVLSVLTNPENRPILDSIRSQAQLYEVVVPGSQGIMSVSSTASLPEHTIPCGSNLSSEGEEDSLASNDTGNVSSPSPAPTESDGTSSLSEDSDSSEKENLTPLRGATSFKQ
ncbi:uncharacterized protein Cipc isoform X2 [Macrobrachium rosenbergii]|uniref:uncharacterized protein Cipc isoform X2 n=1 Tax=Macrobrachium rosenbergii TaxID=79674 RepID=UPI0034D4F29E